MANNPKRKLFNKLVRAQSVRLKIEMFFYLLKIPLNMCSMVEGVHPYGLTPALLSSREVHS